MFRRAFPVLALVACLLVAGCAGGSTPGDGTGTPTATPTATPGPTQTATSTPTATPTPTTTEADPCPPTTTVAERPLPEKPDELTRESAREFASAYETALVYNAQIDEDTLSVSAGVSRASVLNETETGYVVRLEGRFGFTRCRDGAQLAGDGIFDANYFVNDTVVVRLQSPEPETADPRDNGTVVERWG